MLYKKAEPGDSQMNQFLLKELFWDGKGKGKRHIKYNAFIKSFKCDPWMICRDSTTVKVFSPDYQLLRFVLSRNGKFCCNY